MSDRFKVNDRVQVRDLPKSACRTRKLKLGTVTGYTDNGVRYVNALVDGESLPIYFTEDELALAPGTRVTTKTASQDRTLTGTVTGPDPRKNYHYQVELDSGQNYEDRVVRNRDEIEIKPTPKFKEGDRVILNKTGHTATVVRVAKNGQIQVDVHGGDPNRWVPEYLLDLDVAPSPKPIAHECEGKLHPMSERFGTCQSCHPIYDIDAAIEVAIEHHKSRVSDSALELTNLITQLVKETQ